MKEKIYDVLEFCKAFLVIAFILFLIGFGFYSLELEGRRKVVQELCIRQQYDFCEVEEITYKLKEIR